MSRRPARPLKTLILLEIQEIIGHLVKHGLADAQRGSRIIEGSDDTWIVTQSGAMLSLALKNRPYEEVYLDLLGAEGYTALLLDGAMVQIAYEGAGESIVRHRLAYLPSPSLIPYQNDPDLYIHEQHFVEVVGHQVVPVPIRFDYDGRPGVPQNVIHPASHVTFGQYMHCRVPAARPLAPREFAEFILHNFYSTPEMSRVTLPTRVLLTERTISSDEERVVHLSLP